MRGRPGVSGTTGGLTPDQAPPPKPRLDPDGEPLDPGVARQLGSQRFRLGGRIGALAFHPDGKRLLGGGENLVYWDVATGKRLQQLKRDDKHFTTSLTFVKDGSLLLDGHGKGTMLLDAGTGEAIESRNDEEHVAAPRGFAFSPDGKRYVAPMEENRYGIYDAATRKLLHEIKVKESVKFDQPPIAISPDGEWLAMAPGRSAVRIFSMRTGEERAVPDGHCGFPFGLAFVGGSGHLVSGDSTGVAIQWDLEKGEALRSFSPQEYPIYSMAVSQDGRTLFTAGGRKEDAAITDLITATTIVHLSDSNVFRHAVFGSDGRLYGSSSNERRITCFAPRSKEEIFSTYADDSIYSVDLSPDEQTVVCACRRNGLARFETKEGKELPALEGNGQDELYSAAYGAGGRAIFALSDEGALLVYDTKTMEICRRRIEPDLKSYRILPCRTDPRLLMAVDSSGVCLIESASGSIFAHLDNEKEDFCSMALSPDGRTLVTGSTNTTLRVWDVREGFGKIPARANPYTPADLDALWKGLGDTHGRIGYECMVRLYAQPGAALALLRERLLPASINEEKVLACLKRLDAESFAERDRAREDLQGMGETARPLLEKVLEERSLPPSVEARERINWVLKRSRCPVTGSTEMLQNIRGVMLLEWIASDDAREALRKLAAGQPGTRLTQEATDALARLEGAAQGPAKTPAPSPSGEEK
ncbi:MAG: hypothetical protein KIS92_19085 [Planctomycetota bacterium]|nr:hypothetical protein [Planctomycetota bacterium]